MSFSRQYYPIHFNYFVNGTNLNHVFLYKDLCIHLTSSLNFEYHINFTIGIALKIQEFYKRNTKISLKIQKIANYIVIDNS